MMVSKMDHGSNHQETKPFSKKRRVSPENIFSSIKSKNKSPEAEEETTSGRTPVMWSAVNRYLESADDTRVVFSREHRLRGRLGQKSRCIYMFMCIFEKI